MITSFIKNSISCAHLLRGASLIVLASLALLPAVQGALPPPPPGGGYGNNTAVGKDALFSLTTGEDNTALGFKTLRENTEGKFNTAIGSGALTDNVAAHRNTATGFHALFKHQVGTDNTANGCFALRQNDGNRNTAVGSFALQATTGSDNIALGNAAGLNLTTGNNNIDIGNRGVAGESNTIRIGSFGDQTRTFIAGISGARVTGAAVYVNAGGQLGTAPSSERFKDEIKPMDKTSEAIFALEPVTFHYKKDLDPDGIPQFGLVAEELARVNPDLVVRDAEGKPYTVRYDAVNAMLLNEFLKEHRKVQDLESAVEQLTARLKEQDLKVQKMSDQLAATRIPLVGAPSQVAINQ